MNKMGLLLAKVLFFDFFAMETIAMTVNPESDFRLFVEDVTVAEDIDCTYNDKPLILQKDIEEISLMEIQCKLENYLFENYPDLKIGTDDFYDFSMRQLIEGYDKKLCELDDYIIIHAYLAEYVNIYENFISVEVKHSNKINIFSNKICADEYYTDYDLEKNLYLFHLSDDFLKQTIGDIRRNNEKCNADTMLSENTAVDISGYVGEDAANYARSYALSCNSKYPSYLKDCTNFVSQCIYAGGIKMKGNNSEPGVYTSTTQWFCKVAKTDDHGNYTRVEYALTTSWINVADFNSYLTSIAKYKAVRKTFHELFVYSSVGDVIQLKSIATGTPYHSIIISKKADGTIYYCGHSNYAKDEGILKVDISNNQFIVFDLT